MSTRTREPNGEAAALGKARERRWLLSGRRVRSIARAAAFVDDVGFALLFPSERVLAPSLWEAVAGEDAEPFATGMGSDEQRVWAWKDELPRRGLAWYGNFVAGRGSFLSPSLLRWLYPAYGGTDDHAYLDLSPTAHEIARALAEGPLQSATLRALIGDRSRYQRAAVDMQRQLLVTTAGVQEQASGWPSTVLDLTCRRFDVGEGTGSPDRRGPIHGRGARRLCPRPGADFPMAGRQGTRTARRARRLCSGRAIRQPLSSSLNRWSVPLGVGVKRDYQSGHLTVLLSTAGTGIPGSSLNPEAQD